MTVFLNNNKKGSMTVEFNLNNKNNDLGDNMDKYDYSIVIDDVDVLNLVNTINNVLDDEKEDVETLLDINDYNDDVIKGYINIGKLDLEFNEYAIVELVEKTLEALDVKYDRHTMPNVDIGEYYFPITILRDNMINKIEKIYDEIEEKMEEKLVKFDNTFFEIYDDELESRGWIVMDKGDCEFQDEILTIVKGTINEMNLDCKVDTMPSMTLGIYYFGFTIKLSKDGFMEDGVYFKNDLEFCKYNADVYGY